MFESLISGLRAIQRGLVQAVALKPNSFALKVELLRVELNGQHVARSALEAQVGESLVAHLISTLSVSSVRRS